MPDQSDVERALAGWLSRALYPDGVERVSAVEAVCRVFPGWPVGSALEADLAAGVVQVAVRAMPGTLKDTTRYQADMQVTVPPALPSLTVASGGERVVFGGVAAVGQVAGVRVDGRAYAYRVRAGDTPELVAAVLAERVRVDRPVALSGGALGLVGGRGVLGRVAVDGYGGEELRRQTMQFRVGVWAPDALTRDRVAAAVDVAVAGAFFLDVEGWGCQVRGAAGEVSDKQVSAGVWQRELGVVVEFPTVREGPLPSMLFGVGVVDGVVVVV